MRKNVRPVATDDRDIRMLGKDRARALGQVRVTLDRDERRRRVRTTHQPRETDAATGARLTDATPRTARREDAQSISDLANHEPEPR